MSIYTMVGNTVSQQNHVLELIRLFGRTFELPLCTYTINRPLNALRTAFTRARVRRDLGSTSPRHHRTRRRASGHTIAASFVVPISRKNHR